MVKLSMEKKLSHQSNQNIKISDPRYKKNLSGARSVDINILLNRVKIEKVKEQKKNILFIISVVFGICLSGYLIFN